MATESEVILVNSCDVPMLEMGEDEGGAGDVADLAGAGGDVLEDTSRLRGVAAATARELCRLAGEVMRAAYVQGGGHARKLASQKVLAENGFAWLNPARAGFSQARDLGASAT